MFICKRCQQPMKRSRWGDWFEHIKETLCQSQWAEWVDVE